MSQLTVAANESVFRALFAAVRDNFTFANSDSTSSGAFSAGYDVAFHLANGTVDLRADGSIRIEELDIVWDQLDVWVGLDLPEICTPSICLIPKPWGGCFWRVGPYCIFDDNPDIKPTIDLSFLVSEISFGAKPNLVFVPNPARTPGMTDLDAHEAGKAHHWKLFIDPDKVDLDLIDFADTIGNLLEDAILDAIGGLLDFLPGWAKDFVLAIIGSAIDLLRAVLDLPHDIGEWLADVIGTDLDLFNVLGLAVADYFAAKHPLHQIETPYPVQPASGPLFPVLVPIDAMGVTVDDTEITLTADLGA